VIEGSTGSGRDDRYATKYRLAFAEIIGYLKRIARERRAVPQDDLVGTLVASQDGEAGLSDREVIQFVFRNTTRDTELGASLARLEATAALEALLPELPGRVRAGAEFPLVDSYLVRGRQSLQLAAA
jgi:cytochrome P450